MRSSAPISRGTNAYFCSVVFSAWTPTLDMVQTMLVDSNISFTRIDGSVSPKNRATELHHFQSDTTVRVLLITISIGAEG
jgi:SWI/SNF-related matrix-associated actin-dependent regulator of chromatin subfamily A3